MARAGKNIEFSMTGLFPEKPMLFYPSLAQCFGVEEALLLSVYHEFCQHHGAVDAQGQSYFLARRMEWQNLASFWNEEQLATLTNSLVSQRAIEAEFNANGSIRVLILNQMADEAPSVEAPVSKPELPERSKAYRAIQESHPAVPATVSAATTSSGQAKPYENPNTMLARGPAPSFGGSTGWDRPKDDLERLFDQQEKRNQQLHEI
ncbi:MAG: hypothetical protein OQK12_16755, partial [Motiliproteus sp.]|nr:hypothetical protein [Motiliproteus sp.]